MRQTVRTLTPQWRAAAANVGCLQGSDFAAANGNPRHHRILVIEGRGGQWIEGRGGDWEKKRDEK